MVLSVCMCGVSVWGWGDTACVECSGEGGRGEELACSGVLAVTVEWMGVRLGSFRWICFHHDSHSSMHVFQTDIFIQALPPPSFYIFILTKVSNDNQEKWFLDQNSRQKTPIAQELLRKRCSGIFYLVLYTLPTIKSEAGIDGDSEYFMSVSEPRKRIDAHF